MSKGKLSSDLNTLMIRYSHDKHCDRGASGSDEGKMNTSRRQFTNSDTQNSNEDISRLVLLNSYNAQNERSGGSPSNSNPTDLGEPVEKESFETIGEEWANKVSSDETGGPYHPLELRTNRR